VCRMHAREQKLIRDECHRIAGKRLRTLAWLFEILSNNLEADKGVTARELALMEGEVSAKDLEDLPVMKLVHDKFTKQAKRLTEILAEHDRERAGHDNYFYKISRVPGAYKLRAVRTSVPLPVEFEAEKALQQTVEGLRHQQMLIERLLMTDVASVKRAAQIGRIEWTGSEEECRRIFEDSKVWVNDHREDVFVRAALLWSALTRGTLAEMVDIVCDCIEWVGSDLPSETASNGKLDVGSWEKTVDQYGPGPTLFRNLVERHLEDTLVRAAFLRWMKGEGKKSELGKYLRFIHTTLQSKAARKVIDLYPRGAKWLGAAVGMAAKLLGANTNSSLLRLCHLWLLAREKPSDSLLPEIQKTFRWLERHREDTLVRTTVVWLISARLIDRQLDPFISNIVEWLDQKKKNDDSLVWVAFLWLIGRKGTKDQVDDVIVRVTRWLQAHPNDNYVRPAFLLFVLRERGTIDQRRDVAKVTRLWLKDHSDDRITECAVDLIEPKEDCVKNS